MPTIATKSATATRPRLARRRKALGLTQEGLAQLLAVERSTVVRWERGQSEPQPWTRPRLARALKISPDRLETLLTTGGPDGPTAVPRQLPATVADFTGRAAELRTLTQMLDQAGDEAIREFLDALAALAAELRDSPSCPPRTPPRARAL